MRGYRRDLCPRLLCGCPFGAKICYLSDKKCFTALPFGAKKRRFSGKNSLTALPLTLPSPPLFPLRGAVEREHNSETYFRATPK